MPTPVRLFKPFGEGNIYDFNFLEHPLKGFSRSVHLNKITRVAKLFYGGGNFQKNAC